MRVLTIATTNVRRLFRIRTALFFSFGFPMLLILVLGATFGGSFTPRLGVVSSSSGPLEQALLMQLRQTPHLRIVSVGSHGSLVTQVARGRLDAGLVVPPGYDTTITSGGDVTLSYVAKLDQSSQRLGETVRGVVATQAALLAAARFAVSERAASDFSAGLGLATSTQPRLVAVSVSQSVAGKARSLTGIGQFDESAWTELLLFLFLTALNGGLALIETRRLGIERRMLSTPTPTVAIVGGEMLGRMLIGAIQAVVIIVGSAVLYGVQWGQPVGVAAVVGLFVLVAAGAGILFGTLFANEQQAGGVSLLAGLGLAALGGCMVPLEVFSPTMKRVAHLTPHAWANDAFAKLVGHHASVTAIGSQLAVLGVFAGALLALATWQLRKSLVQA